MSTQPLDAYAESLVQGPGPVFVSDLLTRHRPDELDLWVSNQGDQPRFGFLPVGQAASWRETPVLIVPINRTWPWCTDKTLRGRRLYARALEARQDFSPSS